MTISYMLSNQIRYLRCFCFFLFFFFYCDENKQSNIGQTSFRTKISPYIFDIKPCFFCNPSQAISNGVRPMIRLPDSPTVHQSDSPVVRQTKCIFNSYSMKIKYVLYKKYSLSQVLCTVKARCVVKLALQDSYVVY